MVNKLKSRIPYLGNNQALKNHIANALRNAGDLSVVIRNIDAIPKENMDSLTKAGLEKFKNEIIPEIRQIIKETQGETAEQGSKLEQAEAKQEVVKGEGWTMKEGKLTYLDQVKFELDDVLKDQTGIDAVTTSLAWLKSQHPEMHKNKRAIKELIEYVLDRPSVVKSGKSENSVYLGKADDNKMKDIVIDKSDKKIIHANRRRMNAEERGQWQGRPPSLHTDTKPAGANGASARSLTTDSIIPQNSAKDELGIKTYANPHVGAGLAGGTLNAKDENGNFDAEKFAKGFIYGLFGSKVTAATLKKTNPKLYDQIVNIGKDKAGKEKISSFVNKLKQDELGKLLQKTITNKNLSTKTKIEIIEAAKKRFTKETPKSLSGQSEAQMIVKDKDQKEKRGIYNVAYNDKKSTIIYKDLEAIENAIKFEKGFENKVTKKGFGALHIEKHLNEKNAGWVTQQEYLNMGEVVRKGKLNTDKYGRRSYEYYKNGIRFRVAIGYTGKGKDRVISFFSDRKPKNSKKRLA